MDVGQRLAQRGAERALVLGEAVGVQQADGDGLGLERARPPSATSRGALVGQRLEHAVRAACARARATRRSGGTSGAGCAAHSR